MASEVMSLRRSRVRCSRGERALQVNQKRVTFVSFVCKGYVPTVPRVTLQESSELHINLYFGVQAPGGADTLVHLVTGRQSCALALGE